MPDSEGTSVRVTLVADLTESAKSLCEQVLSGMQSDLASVGKSTKWRLYQSAFEDDIRAWLNCPGESLEGFEPLITSGPLEKKSDGSVEVSRHLTYTLGDYTHELKLSIVCNESDDLSGKMMAAAEAGMSVDSRRLTEQTKPRASAMAFIILDARDHEQAMPGIVYLGVIGRHHHAPFPHESCDI